MEVGRINKVDPKKIYAYFQLSKQDQSQLNTALSEYTDPAAKHYSKAIKLGHGAVSSIFGKKKIMDKPNFQIEEFEFYFPTGVDISKRYSDILDYMQKVRYYSPAAKDKLLERKIKNRNELIKFIHKENQILLLSKIK